MQIGINLLPIRRDLTGVGVYAYNIIPELGKIDDENQYILFSNKENFDIFKIEKKNFRTVVLPFNAENVIVRIFWEQFILPFLLKKNRVDILFSPSTVMPIFSTCKNVICIHDLIPFHIYDKFTKVRSFYVRLMIKLSARRADKIFTVSKNSKKEIEQICSIESSKIAITYNGVNKSIFETNITEWKSFRKQKEIPDKYLLYVGTLEPGKNLVKLIRAFKLVKKNYGIDHKLIIAGKKGWKYFEIFREANLLNVNDFIIFTDYVPKNILGELYRNAELFIFPSLYEGFGLPVLEAMAFGVPVIVSDVSALPEVVGKAGELCDPFNEKDIAEKIIKILMDQQLRNKMIAAGKKQASQFDWKNASLIALKTFLSLSRNQACL